MTTTEAGPLPTPPDFPIEWGDPADEQLFWFQDNLHFPLPQTPLNATLFQTSFEIGASAAISRLSMPIEGLRTTVQHGYIYLAPVPVHGDPQTMEDRFAEMQRLTMELGPTRATGLTRDLRAAGARGGGPHPLLRLRRQRDPRGRGLRPDLQTGAH